jgi:transcriptional regulator with XRE-family HTH domain
MGFRENLKSELSYSGMLVKELAARSGVSKRTLDNYLNIRSRIPSADIAVKIAKVLGVPVEYLVTGDETLLEKRVAFENPESRAFLKLFNNLDPEDKKIVFLLAKALNDRKQSKKI